MKIRQHILFLSLACNLALVTGFSVVTYTARDALHIAMVRRSHSMKIAFVGDSLTANGRIWDWRLGNFTGLATSNFGQGSAGIEQIDWITRVRVLPHQPKIVCIMAGSNDAPDGDCEAVGTRYLQLLDAICATGARVVVMSTPPRADSSITPFVRTLNARLLGYCVEHADSATYVDLWPRLTDGEVLRSDMTTDGVHFSETAYATWGRQLAAVLAD